MTMWASHGRMASKSRAKLAKSSINASPRLLAQAPAFESGRLVRARAMDARPRRPISAERQMLPHHSDARGHETPIVGQELGEGLDQAIRQIHIASGSSMLK